MTIDTMFIPESPALDHGDQSLPASAIARSSRLRLLISAFACRPDRGSEPGVGWNVAREAAGHCDVWVFTRTDNRESIEAELTARPNPNLNIVYVDPPRWVMPVACRQVYVHYTMWQWFALRLARRLHAEIGFDVSHHVTYGRYCSPTFLAFMPVPMVWGPVGGGESAPSPFVREFSFKGRMFERLRACSKWMGERDPFVRRAVRKSSVALVATRETRERLETMGASRIEFLPGQTAVNADEIARLGALPPPSDAGRGVRFFSAGRLLHWKGYHLGLRAFAAMKSSDTEFWIAGEGPEKGALDLLARRLGIESRVKFLGSLSRDRAMEVMGEIDVLVHPSLHDFSPTICLEAMAAGRPVVCLDLGGPAGQVTEETGYRIRATTPERSVAGLCEVMSRLSADADLRVRLGAAGRKRVREHYTWEIKGRIYADLYVRVTAGSVRRVRA